MKQDPHYTLGRIRAILEMLERPEVYLMSPEQGVERIRGIFAAYMASEDAPEVTRHDNGAAR